MAKNSSNIIKPIVIIVLGLIVTSLVYRGIANNLEEKRRSQFDSLARSIVIKIQDTIDLQQIALDFFFVVLHVTPGVQQDQEMEVLAKHIISENLLFERFKLKSINAPDSRRGEMIAEVKFEYPPNPSKNWENPSEEAEFVKALLSAEPSATVEKLFFHPGGDTVLYKNLNASGQGKEEYFVAKFNLIDQLPAILYGASAQWFELHLFYKEGEVWRDFLSRETPETLRQQAVADTQYDYFVTDAITIFDKTLAVLIKPANANYLQTYTITKMVVILVGMILTSLLAMWSYTVEVRRQRIEMLVDRRTSELMESNKLLVEEQKENHRLLEELKISQHELSNVADSVAGVLFEYDYTNKRFSYVSRKVELILGVSKGQALSITKPFQLICHPDDYEMLNNSFSTCAQAGEVCNIEFRARKGREDIWLRSIATPVFHDNGDIRFNGVLLDITTFKRLSKERGEMEAQLRQAQKMEAVGQLAAGIAHEINTPAQFVGDNLHYLQDAFGDIGRLYQKTSELVAAIKDINEVYPKACEVQDFFREIDVEFLIGDIPHSLEQSLDGIRRIAEIVGAMKEFSHPGGKEKEVIDLNKAINNTITVARNEWKYVASVVTNLSDKLPFIPVFPGEFNQVILNMIVNAAHAIADKYGNDGEKGTITITTHKSAESVVITIADDGEGIPEENLEKIFDPFFTTKEVGKGTGQGLSMAFKTIVEGHQGTIAVESEVGVGTTFTIKLPVEVL